MVLVEQDLVVLLSQLLVVLVVLVNLYLHLIVLLELSHPCPLIGSLL